MFAQKDIEDRFVRISGSTRIGIKIVDEINQQTTDVNFPGQAPTAQDVRQLFQIVNDLTEQCDWFVLSGSIPAGLSADVYAELVEIIKAKNKCIALDTSGEGLQRALPCGPTLIKPNLNELEELVGEPLESQMAIVQAAQSLREYDIEYVVVSMGAQGAIFVDGEAVVLARPPIVTVKSTVGAGDAMVSGMVMGILQNDSLADCARLATAFSVNAITHVGSGLSSLSLVKDCVKQIAVQHLDAQSGTTAGGRR
jgi:1-phosphofructokinase family hexose kinase